MIARGVYRSRTRIERLDTMPDYIVHSYEGVPPQEVILEVSGTLGVPIGDRKPEELLAEMSQELK